MARVLVIDDEPNIAKVLKEALSGEGYDVMTAHNGLSALELLGREPADIVLADLLMPGATGRVVVENMRSKPKLRDIPVVIVSGSVPGSKEFPPEGTYQAFISKPFDLTDVIETVQTLLEAGGRPVMQNSMKKLPPLAG